MSGGSRSVVPQGSGCRRRCFRGSLLLQVWVEADAKVERVALLAVSRCHTDVSSKVHIRKGVTFFLSAHRAIPVGHGAVLLE
jgi:hypothetical protein